MKKIRQFFYLFYQAYRFVYKKYHCWKSDGHGVLSTEIYKEGTDEKGQAIFKSGKSEMVYRSEPHVRRAEKELARFKKFLDSQRHLDISKLTKKFNI